jgi:outer membrane protein, heavy metal efflux system
MLLRDQMEYPIFRQRAVLLMRATMRLKDLLLPILIASSSWTAQAFDHKSREPIGSSGSSTRLSLNEVIASVLQHNPMIQSAEAKWKAAEKRVPQAGAWEDPKFSVSTVFGRFVSIPANGFTDQMVGVEQMIPLSGKNRSKERAAAAEALQALEEARRQELDVVAKAKSSYYRLASLYQLLDLNRADEASLIQSRDTTQAKFEVGTQGQADLLLADNERQKVIEARKDLEQKVSDEQSSLNVLMNRDPFTPLGRPSENKESSLAASPERLRQLILANRPEVRRAQAMLTAAKAKEELARREWIPDPTLSVQAERYNAASQLVSDVGGGVSFNLPWLNGKKYRAEEAEAQHEVDAASTALVSVQTEAVGLLRNQLQKIETLHHHMELYRDNLLPTARRTVDSYRADYEGNKTTLLTLLSAQRDLFDLEKMYYQDLGDYQIAQAELEALVGLGQKTSAVGKSTMGDRGQ